MQFSRASAESIEKDGKGLAERPVGRARAVVRFSRLQYIHCLDCSVLSLSSDSTKLVPAFPASFWLPAILCLTVGCGRIEPGQSVESAPRPNILFAIADDASHVHFGAYGAEWVETPSFDRIAEQGVLFLNAYTPNAKCAPSRASILTGRNSWQLGAAGNHWPFFPEEFRTYTEALRDDGYHVGHTGKGWAPGIAEIDGQPRFLTGEPFNQRRLQPPTSGISSEDYAANFRDFLDSVPEGQPFSFWYGAREPHRGYEYGSGVRAGKRLAEIEEVYPAWPDNEAVRTDLLDYALEIEHFDRHLGLMLEILEERGLLENTIVVATSDNGMPFPRIKGQEYELSNHLPLAVMWPRGITNPGREVADFVSFIDFAPTFLELAGLSEATGGMQPIAGRSLTDILYSEVEGQVNPARDHVLIGKERHDVGRPRDEGYPIRGIVADGYLYLRNYEPDRWPAGNPETGYLNSDGGPTKTEVLKLRRSGTDRRYWAWSFGKRPSEELYDLQSDPHNILNLATMREHMVRRETLAARMEAELREQEDPRMFGRGNLFDEYPYADTTGRGFYERFMAGETLRAGWVEPSDFEPEPIPPSDQGAPDYHPSIPR
jgi:arylsulfatase A-like enzyme